MEQLPGQVVQEVMWWFKYVERIEKKIMIGEKITGCDLKVVKQRWKPGIRLIDEIMSAIDVWGMYVKQERLILHKSWMEYSHEFINDVKVFPHLV